MSGVFVAQRGTKKCPHCGAGWAQGELVAFDRNVLMHQDCARSVAQQRAGVVSLDVYREAKAALELVQDLQSIAGSYGYDLQLSFTTAGVSAVLCRGGFRALTVEPCRDVQTAGNRVMCWLEAQR